VIFPAGTIVGVCAEPANREAGSLPGQNLAKAELEEALAFLAPRLPGLRLAGTEQLGEVERIYSTRGLVAARIARRCSGL